jgi:mRNA interferase RelE/StbE
MRSIRYSRLADKALAQMPLSHAEKIEKKIEAYAINPSAFANQIKALRGTNVLRLRVDDYRVIFNEDFVVLDILAIGHRREIYKAK